LSLSGTKQEQASSEEFCETFHDGQEYERECAEVLGKEEG